MQAVVGPTREFHGAFLLVEWEIFNIDACEGREREKKKWHQHTKENNLESERGSFIEPNPTARRFENGGREPREIAVVSNDYVCWQ